MQPLPTWLSEVPAVAVRPLYHLLEQQPTAAVISQWVATVILAAVAVTTMTVAAATAVVAV